MNVVNMSGRQASAAMQPNKPIIEALEKILAEAREGRVQHLAGAYSDGISPPSDFYIGGGEPEQAMMLIGALELCKHTMLMCQYQETATAMP